MHNCKNCSWSQMQFECWNAYFPVYGVKNEFIVRVNFMSYHILTCCSVISNVRIMRFLLRTFERHTVLIYHWLSNVYSQMPKHDLSTAIILGKPFRTLCVLIFVRFFVHKLTKYLFQIRYSRWSWRIDKESWCKCTDGRRIELHSDWVGRCQW